ncbi:hypothetical protein BaRGS_00019403 [Batillaria attramentaria]|uniref:Uncharacterized protein n=1 Tax=Batillaria attramentaria TaxID=370345 RepID=A0ABD0KRD4_9CAEN
MVVGVNQSATPTCVSHNLHHPFVSPALANSCHVSVLGFELHSSRAPPLPLGFLPPVVSCRLTTIVFPRKEGRSVKTFLDLLYQDRGFLRANEVHARLGLMFKVLKNYEGSLKHFKLRLSDESECTISNVETRIHIAHLLEIQSRVKAAKESYDKFLQGDTLPPTLKATALRQLGKDM